VVVSGGGGLQSMQIFTSGGTWNKPVGINSVRVFVVGGGGSGGTASGSGAGGGVVVLLNSLMFLQYLLKL